MGEIGIGLGGDEFLNGTPRGRVMGIAISVADFLQEAQMGNRPWRVFFISKSILV
ncbi:MAG: hypothetical protein WC256_04980 [Desulfurivibrionaceae bacterium]